MSLTENVPPVEAPQTGGKGFYKPKRIGFWHLGPVGSIVCVLAAFGCIAAIAGGQPLYVPVAIIGATLLTLAYVSAPDTHGKSALQRHVPWLAWRQADKQGLTSYVPMGEHKLPGVLASSELYEFNTTSGEPFAVVRYPSSHLYAVTVGCQPDGASMLDPSDIAGQVLRHGEWLGSLALEPDLVQCIITIETTADGGPALQASIRSKEAEDAHPLSKVLMTKALEKYPQGSQGVLVSATATFRAPAAEIDLDGKRVKTRNQVDEVEQVGTLLGTRMPHLWADLPECGAGNAVPYTADDLIERVRVAFNPGDRTIYAAARAAGKPRPLSLWTSAGPSGHYDRWNWYEHGDGGSITWEFTGFTGPLIQADSLLPLLETGGKDDTSTRISIIYRPLPAGKAGRAVESNYNAAKGRRADANRPKASHTISVDDADRARYAAAAGHAVFDFSIVVTTTAENARVLLPKAKAAVAGLAPNARLRLRPCNGIQAAMFAQGLGPLGLVMSKHLRLPAALTNGV